MTSVQQDPSAAITMMPTAPGSAATTVLFPGAGVTSSSSGPVVSQGVVVVAGPTSSLGFRPGDSSYSNYAACKVSVSKASMQYGLLDRDTALLPGEARALVLRQRKGGMTIMTQNADMK